MHSNTKKFQTDREKRGNCAANTDCTVNGSGSGASKVEKFDPEGKKAKRRRNSHKGRIEMLCQATTF